MCRLKLSSLFMTFSLVAVIVVVPECDKSSATTYFWYRQTLNITSSIDDTGGLNWKMTLSLLVAWILVCMAVIKGIQSSGKVQGLFCFTAGVCRLSVCLLNNTQKIITTKALKFYF